MQRTGDEVKLEWTGLRKDVIEKDAEVKVTGGGRAKEKHVPFDNAKRSAHKSRVLIVIRVKGHHSASKLLPMSEIVLFL